ncbi:MAG TPA: NAD(P)-dependent oxidoreductase [Candidatus Polarisedimenticolia bacterium]|nr:NAD(P)-dependent oxidoreductase [Candidatus Polarisedimenticolia bacterium]
MRILVTGGSGHVGSWTAALLVERGHQVACLGRRPEPGPGGLPPIVCDLADPDQVAGIASRLAEFDAVVHLAAHVPEDTWANLPRDAQAALDANAAGTASLLAALAAASVPARVVHASTFEVYGAGAPAPVAESHPARPITHYGATKLAAETYVALHGADRGVPCCSLRLPAVYGPGDTRRRALGNFIRAAAHAAPLVVQGGGEDRRDLLYVADAARALALAAEAGARGVYNAGSGQGWSILEMAQAVLAASGGGSRIEHAGRVKPRADLVLDSTRIERDLGWRAETPLAEGAAAQLAWVRGGT